MEVLKLRYDYTERMFEAIGFRLNHTDKVGWWVDGRYGFNCSGYFSTREEAVITAVKKILAVENGSVEGGAWYRW